MIPLFKVFVAPGVPDAVSRVLGTGYIGQGPEVEKFEAELEPWMGRRPLTLNAGTSALHLALHLAGVGPGDEVVSTPMTCFATNAPIIARGARIVWADIDPKTGNIDPEDVRRKITPKTKAVMCVDWGGLPCELDQLSDAVGGLPLIEDAAHAFGAIYRDRHVGSIADFTGFSFQAIKHLTTVDGGALTCLSKKDYKRGKLLRWYGIDREGPRKDLRCEEDILEAGYKFHMNDVNAVVGRVQLGKVSEVLEAHRDNAEFYRRELYDLKHVHLLRHKADRESSCWLFTILVDDRESFRVHMEREGIATSQVHVRNDIHTATRPFRCELPGVDEFASRQVSIPVGWWLSRDDRKKIAEAVVKWDRI